ncbi:MAG: winged helix-turn-helix domain-containing protein [Acidobacteriota bacterium]
MERQESDRDGGIKKLASRQAPFELVGRRVEPELLRVTHGGSEVQVEPRIMGVLVALAHRSGRVVTRDQLLDEVWEGAAVGDEVITRAISELRRLFGDNPRQPRVIETIRKRGYRLLVEVRLESATTLSPTSLDAPVTTRAFASRPAGRSMGLPGRALSVLLALALVIGIVVSAQWLVSKPEARSGSLASPSQRLSSLPGLEVLGDVSADGDRIVLVNRPDVHSPSDLWLLTPTGDPAVRMSATEQNEVSPTWSPKTDRIAYARYLGDQEWSFEIRALVGGEARVFFHSRSLDWPSLNWSPDGRFIAMSVRPRDDGLSRVWLYDLSSEQIDDSIATPGKDFVMPVWSPDGRSLAVLQRWSAVSHDLFVIGLDEEGVVRQLTDERTRITDLGWTPDGRRLVFASERLGAASLWIVDADGRGEIEPLAAAAGALDIESLAIARDRGSLVYERRNLTIDLLHHDPQTSSELRAIFPSSRVEHSPRPSPGGERFAFLSDRSGRPALWIAQGDGKPEEIAVAGIDFSSAPRWSPDGELLAFTSVIEGNADVWLLHAEDFRLQRLTDGPERDLAPSWSADGRFVFFGSNRGGTWNLWRQAPSEAQAELEQEEALTAVELADGSLLYTSVLGGLWIRTPNGETVQQDIDLPARYWDNWWPAPPGAMPSTAGAGPGGVYVVRSDGFGVELHDLTSGDSRTVLEVESPIPNHGLTVMPDGSLVVAVVSRNDSDLMWIEEMSWN